MNEAVAAAEIVTDESKKVLWVESYIFRSIHRVGDTFIRAHKEYQVLHAYVTSGRHGGFLVEHVVKLIADRTPDSAS